jgi:anti-sigma B factor antagonist
VHDQGTVGEPVLVLRFAGELDGLATAAVRRRLERAITGGARRIVVDLSEVTFVESISLATLVAARHRLAPDGRLAVVADDGFVRLVLEAAGLMEALNVFGDVDAARDYAFGPGGGRGQTVPMA